MYRCIGCHPIVAHVHLVQGGTGGVPWERLRGSLREVLAIALYRAKGRIRLLG